MHSAWRDAWWAKLEENLHRLLATLQRKEFLYEQPAFPETEYLFKHALTQDVAYNSLLHERRKIIHERTGQAIELTYQHELDDHYGDLAHHYHRSGNVEKAIEYLQLAGAQAAKRSANADAANHFGTALKLLDGLPTSPESQRRSLAALMPFVVNLMVVKGIGAPEIGEAYERARVLCERVGTATELCAVLIGVRVHLAVSGDSLNALKCANELLRVAESTQDPELICHGFVAGSVSKLYVGRFAEARDDVERGLALYDYERNKSQTLRYGFDAGIGALNFATHIYWALGFPAQAQNIQVDSSNLVRKLDHPYMTGFWLTYNAMMSRMRLDHATCLATTEILVPLAVEHGFREWLAAGLILRGWANSRERRNGLADVVEGLAINQQFHSGMVNPLWLGSLADVHANLGNLDAALNAIADGLAFAEHSGEHWFDAELYRLRSEFTLRLEKNESLAEQTFERAIQIAQQQQAKPWELRATVSLAKLWATQGKAELGRQRLARVYAWFTEGFDTPDLQAARVMLDQT